MCEKPLRIRIYKIDRFIKVYDEIRYLVIFDYCLYDEIYNMIRYLISEKSGITYSINHNFARIRTDSCTFLDEILTFHNVLILIQSVTNKNRNHHYFNKEARQR